VFIKKNLKVSSAHHRLGPFVPSVAKQVSFVICILILLACGREATHESQTWAQHDENTIGSRVNAFNKEITAPMLICPDRVWPGYDFRKLTIYLTDSNKKQAYVWTAADTDEASQVKTINFGDVGPEFTSGMYGYGKDPLHPEMGLSLSETEEIAEWQQQFGNGEYLVSLGIHEAFHIFEQPKWLHNDSTISGSRASDFPAQAKPRYLRYMMLKSMIAYLDSRQEQDLMELAALYDSYKKEFGAEQQQIHGTDRSEGTAMYTEFVGTAIAKRGCDASERIIEEELLKQIKTRFEISLDADTESYSLGAAAGAIMRLLPELKGWEEKIMQKGVTPLDVLTEKQQRAEPALDGSILAKATAMIDNNNKESARIVDDFIRAYSDPTTIGIVIAVNRMLGSFSVQNFLNVTAKQIELNTNFTASFSSRSADHGSLIKISTTTMDVTSDSTPCNEEGYAFFLTADELEGHLNSDLLTIETSGIKAHAVAYHAKKDASGRSWICL
jgi:hypothetical protein